MSASLNDKISDTRNAARPNSARVNSPRTAGAATLVCDNLTGWPTASKVHFVTYKIDSSSAVTAGTQLDCYGIVSGNSITSFTVVDGTDVGHAVNDVVEMLPTAAWGQDLADALNTQHTRTGTHKSITTDTISTTGNATIGGAVAVTGATTLTGAVGGAGYSLATIANPCKFSVYRNAAASTTLTSSETTVTVFDTKVYDTGTNFSISTGLFTAPAAGFYLFNTAMSMASVTSGIIYYVAIIKNGVLTARSGRGISSATANYSPSLGIELQLSANDTVGIAAVTTSSTFSLEVGGVTTWFTGSLRSLT